MQQKEGFLYVVCLGSSDLTSLRGHGTAVTIARTLVLCTSYVVCVEKIIDDVALESRLICSCFADVYVRSVFVRKFSLS